MYKYLVFVLLTVLFAGIASAEVTFSSEKINIQVDYADFKDNDDDFIDRTVSVTLTNNGLAEDVTVTVQVPSTYKVTAPQKVTIPGQVNSTGGTKTVDFILNVPHEKEGGEQAMGAVVITKADGTTTSIPLVQNTKSMFRLVEIEVDYTDSDGDATDDVFDGDEPGPYALDKDVQPFSKLKFKFDLENRFDGDYDNDGELETIELTFEADDSDILPSDFEEEYDLDNMDADSKLSKTLEFVLDEDADPGNYEFEITIIAEDGQGIEYEITRKIELEIEQENDDLRVVHAEFVPETVTTCASSAQLDVVVKNFGSDDQVYGAVTLYNAELGIDEKFVSLDIEEHGQDDTWVQSITFPLKDPSIKTYDLDLRVFVDNDKLTDQKSIPLVVKDCAGTTSTDKLTTNASGEGGVTAEDQLDLTEQDTTAIVPSKGGAGEAQQTTTGTKTTLGNIVQSVEDPYTSQDVLLALIVIAIVLIVVVIGLFAAILLKR